MENVDHKLYWYVVSHRVSHLYHMCTLWKLSFVIKIAWVLSTKFKQGFFWYQKNIPNCVVGCSIRRSATYLLSLSLSLLRTGFVQTSFRNLLQFCFHLSLLAILCPAQLLITAEDEYMVDITFDRVFLKIKIFSHGVIVIPNFSIWVGSK